MVLQIRIESRGKTSVFVFHKFILYICTKGIKIFEMDYTKLTDINYYIDFAIGDTEGVGIDGGVKYGGTTIIFFPDKEQVDKFASLPAIGDRKKLYGTMVMDYEKGDILKLDIHNWDGSLVNPEELKKQTIIILYDRITNGKQLNYIAERFRQFEVGEVYVYASTIDEDVFDKNTDVFTATLDNGIVGELYVRDTALYDKHNRITLIDEPFFDYLD